MQGDRNEAFRLAAVLLSRDGGLYEVAIGLTTVLVAQDRGGQVVGALVMHPALNVLRQFLTAGLPLPEAVVFAMTVGKLRGLAVSEPVRHQGIGSALLSFGKRAYFQAGYYVIFGQLVTGRGLEDYYRGRGFEVLGKSEPLSLDVILGKPAAVGPESPDERLFVKWRCRGRTYG